MQTTRRCPEASPTLDGMTLRHKTIIVWEGGFSEMQVIGLPYKLWTRCFPSEAKCKQCWPRRERAESHLHGVHITDEFHAGISKQAEKKPLLLRHVIHTHTAGYGGFAVASHSDLHYQDEMLCIDEFEKMESAEIWKGEWQSQHFCFQISLFFTHTIKNTVLLLHRIYNILKNVFLNK